MEEGRRERGGGGGKKKTENKYHWAHHNARQRNREIDR